MLMQAVETLRNARVLALIGASAEPGKYGHKLLTTLKNRFRVLPVNPKRSEIEGLSCYPSYAELPERPDVVVVALAPQVTESVIPRLIAAGAPMLWLPPECFTGASVTACRESGTPVLYDVCPVAALLTLDRLAQTSAEDRSKP